MFESGVIPAMAVHTNLPTGQQLLANIRVYKNNRMFVFLCVCVCLSVPKDIANRKPDMVIFTM